MRPEPAAARRKLPSVLLFTDSDAFAGTERHILDLATALRAEGAVAEIACPAQGALARHAAEAGLPVLAVEKGSALDLRAIWKIRAALRTGRYDLVHSHNGRTALLAALGTLLAGQGATVTTQHFLQPSRLGRRGWRGWLSSRLHRWVLGRAAVCVAISEAVRATILERGELPPAKVVRVWNGIADPAAATLRTRAVVRAELQLKDSTPLIVCAARLQAEKQVDVLIAAMAQVRAEVPEVCCVVAGEGKEEGTLRAQVEAAGLGKTVRLLGFQPDVLSLVQAADLFVLPSAAEPFGLALVEAMALRRPVIATRAGGPLEIVVDGESGLLVPPGDSNALAGAILRVLREPGLDKQLGKAARERFEEHFTASTMGKAMLKAYELLAPIIPQG